MNYIEKVLRFKAETEGCGILVGQWEYDRKLIPDALKAVVIMFPHFSQHDESHSETILDNIVNVLGKEVIVSLSCTDLWLLLESAYCHDLGMVITASKIQEAFNDGSFMRFYHTAKVNSSHILHKYTTLFEEKDGKLLLKHQELNLSTFDAIKFLFAEYFRSQHGANATGAISNPVGHLGVDSPRAVIPTRLYQLLGNICYLHTQDFSEVLKLPYIENGISLDKAHPRFVACMLRIGDLLDLDNHRFNETLMRTLEGVPENSLDHREKHRSINHFRVDNKYIEVSALCQSPSVAVITRQWFDWIRDEFTNQTLHWNDIVPSEINGYLPTVNQLSVDIEGYLPIEKNDIPKFTIDVDKALELLRGKNLYKSPYDSIREILQNAVDSTLIRLFLDAENDGEVLLAPDEKFKERTKNYPIHVTIKRDTNGLLCVSIEDRGMGLKRSHLRFLSNTGSSSQNVDKHLIVSKMPDWLRPSGIFGIGFQSIFLLTDEVRIQTKDYQTDECWALEMHKPNSKMRGEIYLRALDHRRNSGFTIEFTLNEEWSKKPISKDVFSGIDADEVENSLSKSITQYAESSFIPIYLNGKEIETRSMLYFDKETNIQLSFGNLDYGNQHTIYYFKNAKVESGGPNIPFLHPTINLLGGSARNYLSLDRNSFDGTRKEEIEKKVVNAIYNFMQTDNYDTFVSQNENAKQIFSLFSEKYGLDLAAEKILPKSQLGFNISGTNLFVEEMLNYREVTFTTVSEHIIQKEDNAELNSCKIESSMVFLPQLAIIDDYFTFLFAALGKRHQYCICKRLKRANFFIGGEFLFTDDDAQDTDITINDIDRLINITEKREYILYVKGYDALRIPSDKGLDDDIFMRTNLSKGRTKKMEKILSPFLKINDVPYDCRTEKLYEYVSELNGKPIDDIRKCYDKFVADCKAKGIKFEKYEFW